MFYNGTNKHVYSQSNAQVLAAAALQHGWSSAEFAGFHQWKSAGRIVRKGEQGTPVFFFVPKKTEAGEVKVRKTKYVFNLDQTEPIYPVPLQPTEHDIDGSQITAYIEANYPELSGCEISIGRQGTIYRAVVIDGFGMLHTIKIAADSLRVCTAARLS